MAVGRGRHADDGLVEVDGSGRAIEAGVAVVEDPPVGGHEPIAAPVRGGRHAHDGLVQMQAAGRAVEGGVAEAEDPPVRGHLPVAPGSGRLGHAHHRRVEVLAAHRPVEQRVAVREDPAVGGIGPVALGRGVGEEEALPITRCVIGVPGGVAGTPTRARHRLGQRLFTGARLRIRSVGSPHGVPGTARDRVDEPDAVARPRGVAVLADRRARVAGQAGHRGEEGVGRARGITGLGRLLAGGHPARDRLDQRSGRTRGVLVGAHADAAADGGTRDADHVHVLARARPGIRRERGGGRAPDAAVQAVQEAAGASRGAGVAPDEQAGAGAGTGEPDPHAHRLEGQEDALRRCRSRRRWARERRPSGPGRPGLLERLDGGPAQ